VKRGYAERPMPEDMVEFLAEAEWHKTCGMKAVVMLENTVWEDAPDRLHYCMMCSMSIHPEYATKVVSEEPYVER
jgi:hypothetical protein